MRECNAGSAGGTILVEQLSISEGSTPPWKNVRNVEEKPNLKSARFSRWDYLVKPTVRHLNYALTVKQVSTSSFSKKRTRWWSGMSKNMGSFSLQVMDTTSMPRWSGLSKNNILESIRTRANDQYSLALFIIFLSDALTDLLRPDQRDYGRPRLWVKFSIYFLTS